MVLETLQNSVHAVAVFVYYVLHYNFFASLLSVHYEYLLWKFSRNNFVTADVGRRGEDPTATPVMKKRIAYYAY